MTKTSNKQLQSSHFPIQLSQRFGLCEFNSNAKPTTDNLVKNVAKQQLKATLIKTLNKSCFLQE